MFLSVDFGTTSTDFSFIFDIKSASASAFIEVALETGRRKGGIIDTSESGEFLALSKIGTEASLRFVAKITKFARDSAENSTRHLHEADRKDQRKNLDGETNDETKSVTGANSRSYEGPTGELGGAKEEAKHWIEDNHGDKNIFPFFEPLFGIRKHVTNKGDRSDHDKNGDKGLAKTKRDETNKYRDDGTNKSANKWPDKADNSDTSNSATADESGSEGGPVNIADFTNAARVAGLILDVFKESANTGTKDIATIYSEGADKIG